MASVSNPRRLRGRRPHLGAVHSPLRNAEVETLLNIGNDLRKRVKEGRGKLSGYGLSAGKLNTIVSGFSSHGPSKPGAAAAVTINRYGRSEVARITAGENSP